MQVRCVHAPIVTAKRCTEKAIDTSHRLAGDITFKHLAITGPRKLWTQEKVILIGDAAHSMLPRKQLE
jgi:2-polyprenyl-6-methoxyphenol hydroxylase-like FAD-dependent oxidoreductase